MTDLNDYDIGVEPPTFYEVLQAASDAGLVGEEDTVLTLVLAMVRGNLIIMTGPSRSGKDAAVDAAESVFNVDDLVYRWPVGQSPTACYYNRNTINRYPVHRFPDLARLEDHQEKILKAFGEGRDAKRDRTDMTIDPDEQEQVEEQVLTCPKTVIAFIASDNENVDLNDFPELRNRALMLSVDASAEQTRRVNRRKAEEHAGRTEQSIDPMRRAEIQAYHGQIPVRTWGRDDHKIYNPAAIEIHEQQPIPEMFPESRQDFDRLLGFMETVTLYNYAQRLTLVDGNGQHRMYTAPVDVWQAMTIMGNKMVMSALNLTKEDRAVLDLLDDSTANLTKADIQQNLRAQGFHITDRDVRRSLDSMRTKGYVRQHQGNPNSYSFNDFGSVVKHDAGLDYEAIVDAAAESIYDIAPADAADLYVEEFCRGDGLIAIHPFTGEAVDIREHDDLAEMMDTGIKEVEQVFDNDNDNGGGGNAVDQAQGTLT